MMTKTIAIINYHKSVQLWKKKKSQLQQSIIINLCICSKKKKSQLQQSIILNLCASVAKKKKNRNFNIQLS